MRIAVPLILALLLPLSPARPQTASVAPPNLAPSGAAPSGAGPSSAGANATAAHAATPTPVSPQPGAAAVQAPAAMPGAAKPASPAAAAAAEAGPTVGGLTAAEAYVVFAVLADPTKRAALGNILSHLSHAVQGSDDAAAAKPAVAPVLPLQPDSLGAELLGEVQQGAGQLWAQVRRVGDAIDGLPLVGHWLVRGVSTPGWRKAIIDTAWRLTVAGGAALLSELLAARLLRAPRRALLARASKTTLEATDTSMTVPMLVPETSATSRRHLPHYRATAAWRLLARLPLALGRLVLELLPLAVFVGVISLLLSSGLADRLDPRLAVFALVNAYILTRVVICVTRMLVSPDTPALRFLPMSDGGAQYIVRWVRRLMVVGAFGAAVVDIGDLFGLYPAAHDVLIKLIALVDHVFLIVIVLQTRAAVARRIHAPKHAGGLIAALCNRFAHIWHFIAILYIAAFWIVTAAGVQDGYRRLLHFFIITFAVAITGRIVAILTLGAFDRGLVVSPTLTARYPTLEGRINAYHPMLRGMISALVTLLTAIVLLEAWGFDVIAWLTLTTLGTRVASAVATVGVAVLLALVVWLGANLLIERHLAQLTRSAQIIRAARLRTLLPMLRTLLSASILVIVGLTILSEIGINIAPLLAGAGIIGVAIGFGSQKLVQDFITGIFLLLENAMQVGDWITVAGLSGTVENLSIRTIRIRAADGSVSIIPFSSVTTVNNTNRGIGNASVSVNVGLHEDIDRVCRTLAEIASDMRRDPPYKDGMLTDLQLWGVDKIDAAVVTIAGQIVCTDAGRWPVQREFNRRMLRRFAELGIGIVSPSQTVVVSATGQPFGVDAPGMAAAGPPGHTARAATGALAPAQVEHAAPKE